MPSAVLSARDISKSHGSRDILNRVTLQVDGATRLGVVGPNGSGKSTLLRVLAGLEPANSGEVTRLGAVGYLPQVQVGRSPGETVRESIMDRLGVESATLELGRLTELLERGDTSVIAAHAAALERWLARGGDDAEARLNQAAARVGLSQAMLDQPLMQLSGGQAARAGLAALVTARFDALLLDEPTNHLDGSGLACLGSILAERGGGFVVVSHDRSFLAESCEEILELEPSDGTGTLYRGGWRAYERERSAARARQAHEYELAVERRERNLAVEREMRRRAEASASQINRRPRDGDKHAKEWVRSRADGAAARARKVGERAGRIEMPQAPRIERSLRLDLSGGERAHGMAIVLEAAVIERSGWRWGPCDLALGVSDRLLLQGPNGSGKSSLIAALAGDITLAAGRRILPPSAKVAILGQDRSALVQGDSVVGQFRNLAGVGEAEARASLAGFGLGPEVVERPPGTLSPGELTRAELASLGQRRVTCLLLDEPSNHLDIESLEILEGALADWDGALVVASHDTTLRERLGFTRKLQMPEGLELL